MKEGYWKDLARQCITHHMAKAAAAGMDREATIKAVDAAYPWGPRKNYPYTAWLAVRRELLFGIQPKEPPARPHTPSEAQKLRAAGEPGLFDEVPHG